MWILARVFSFIPALYCHPELGYAILIVEGLLGVERSMVGYAVAYSACFGCGSFFSYNPKKVPSIRVEGGVMPVCKGCVERVNVDREHRGLEPITYPDDAYGPSNELDF